MKLTTIAAAALLAAAASLIVAPTAAADPSVGCDTVGHPVLLSWIEKRTICDGPRYPDGHWDRVRILWIPAHTVNASSYCGDYGCSFSPAESYDETVVERQTYPVSDAPGAENQPLPDEPGWLPPGTDNLR